MSWTEVTREQYGPVTSKLSASGIGDPNTATAVRIGGEQVGSGAAEGRPLKKGRKHRAPIHPGKG